MIGDSKAHKITKHWLKNANGGTINQADLGKRLGSELGYRYMDIVD
jgi:hypothetical protein